MLFLQILLYCPRCFFWW